jgi:hypothetical protein
MIKLLVFDNSKGFKTKAKAEEAAKRAVKAVTVMMQDLEPFPDDIEIGFGFKFEKAEVYPHVNLMWDDTKVNLYLEDAISHANWLMGGAEATETDAFITSFFAAQGVTIAETQVFLQRFAEYRLEQSEAEASA